mgnify:FL=1
MSAAAVPSPDLLHHLDRAAAWRLLGQIFGYPGEGWRQQLETLAGCVRDGQMAALAQTVAREGSPELWMRLFGPDGPVRARAVVWEGGLQPGYLLAELEGYFQAFGYRAGADGPPDALPVLLDFAAWLELKLAYAIVQREEEAAGVTGEAPKTFLERFVSAVAWPVFRQLEATGPDFLAAAARTAAMLSGPEPSAQAPAADVWPDGSPLEDAACETQRERIVQIDP